MKYAIVKSSELGNDWRAETHIRAAAREAFRNLCRYKTHGGYTWAAVLDDGELLCVRCCREHYRRMLESIRDNTRDGWQCEGITNSGESEESETCAHCGRVIWEKQR